SDTVGFIQKLPTTLIESFKSTLEEAADSDFLIHAIDNNAADLFNQYDTVVDLIDSLDMKDSPQLVLFDKGDVNYDKRLLPLHSHAYVKNDIDRQVILQEVEDFMKEHFSC